MQRVMFASIWRRLAGFFRDFNRSQTPSEPPIAPENVTQATAPSVAQDMLVCTDRNGHDLQLDDFVAVVGETGDNVWYVYQITDCGEFQYVHILRWRPYYVVSHHPKLLSIDVNTDIERRKELPSTGIMERRDSINSDLIFLERPMNEGEIRLDSHVYLILSVRDTGKQFVFDADQVERLTIGHRDPETDETPDVDLYDVGALEKGVSRRHAAIIRKDGALQIVDNGTLNGTYLNVERLMPRQPLVIHDGDDIRLGHLVLRVWFR